MRVCVYPVPAISGIRPGTAVERRNAGLCLPDPGDFKGESLWSVEMQVCVYLVPAISRIRPGAAVERRNASPCQLGLGDFKDSSGNRCGA